MQYLDFPNEDLDNVRGLFEDKDLSDKERETYQQVDSEYINKIAKLIERIRPDITTEGVYSLHRYFVAWFSNLNMSFELRKMPLFFFFLTFSVVMLDEQMQPKNTKPCGL